MLLTINFREAMSLTYFTIIFQQKKKKKNANYYQVFIPSVYFKRSTNLKHIF